MIYIIGAIVIFFLLGYFLDAIDWLMDKIDGFTFFTQKLFNPKKPINEEVQKKKLVLTHIIDNEMCVGCGECEDVCSHKAMKVDVEKMRATCNHTLCTGCGACARVCPTDAIQVSLEYK